MSTEPPAAERRRDQRVSAVIPVEVEWTTSEGTRVRERAETEVVSAYGALLRLRTRYSIAAQVNLNNPSTGQSVPAYSAWTESEADGSVRLAVALSTPSRAFWGIPE